MQVEQEEEYLVNNLQKRLHKLNEIAISQMRTLLADNNIKRLK